MTELEEETYSWAVISFLETDSFIFYDISLRFKHTVSFFFYFEITWFQVQQSL